MNYQKVILGGTFDLLHKGHKKLLTEAFKLGDFVRIGITTDDFNQERNKITFENLEIREKNLANFLAENFPNRFKIHHIQDILGDAENDPALKAILVTPETENNAKSVNQARTNKGYSPLEIVVVKPTKDSHHQVISSTRIRNGEIDDQGTIFLEFLVSIADKPLSEQIKNHFKEPFGKVIQNIPQEKKFRIITVGDITTKSFLEAGISPDLAIVDLRTRRHDQFNSVAEIGFPESILAQKITNPAGLISTNVIHSLQTPESSVLLVEGEEDLAVIPAVLLSALGTKVYYGQPDQGIVEVEVTPDVKQKLVKILKTN